MGVGRSCEPKKVASVQELGWHFIESSFAATYESAAEERNFMAEGANGWAEASWNARVYDGKSRDQTVLVYLIADFAWNKEQTTLVLMMHCDSETNERPSLGSQREARKESWRDEEFLGSMSRTKDL